MDSTFVVSSNEILLNDCQVWLLNLPAELAQQVYVGACVCLLKSRTCSDITNGSALMTERQGVVRGGNDWRKERIKQIKE